MDAVGSGSWGREATAGRCVVDADYANAFRSEDIATEWAARSGARRGLFEDVFAAGQAENMTCEWRERAVSESAQSE